MLAVPQLCVGQVDGRYCYLLTVAVVTVALQVILLVADNRTVRGCYRYLHGHIVLLGVALHVGRDVDLIVVLSCDIQRVAQEVELRVCIYDFDIAEQTTAGVPS